MADSYVGAALVVSACGEAHAGVAFRSLIILLQDEVDHTADRVGTVDRGRTIRQHLDTIHCCNGDFGKVNEHLAPKTRDRIDRRAPTIDEDERVEIAQLRLAAAARILVGVVGVAVAGIAAAGKGWNLLADELERVARDAATRSNQEER